MLDYKKMSWQQIFWKTSSGVLVRTDKPPGPKLRLAILCRNWNSLLRTASLLEKTTLWPFMGTSGK